MSPEETSGVGGTLADMPASSKALIDDVDAGDGARMRLISMGLHRGVEIEMKNNSGRGPVLVAFGSSRVALGRCLARKIRVR